MTFALITLALVVFLAFWLGAMRKHDSERAREDINQMRELARLVRERPSGDGA